MTFGTQNKKKHSIRKKAFNLNPPFRQVCSQSQWVNCLNLSDICCSIFVYIRCAWFVVTPLVWCYLRWKPVTVHVFRLWNGFGTCNASSKIAAIRFVERNNSKLKILTKLISFRLNPAEGEQLPFVDKHNFDYVLPKCKCHTDQNRAETRTHSGQINLETQ